MTVSAGGDQRRKGWCQFRKSEIVCGNVSANMMDRDQRFSGCEGKSLCKIDTDQQRTDQPRRVGNGNRIHGIQSSDRLYGFADKSGNCFHVRTGRDFRHDSSVQSMGVDLR